MGWSCCSAWRSWVWVLLTYACFWDLDLLLLLVSCFFFCFPFLLSIVLDSLSAFPALDRLWVGCIDALEIPIQTDVVGWTYRE